MKATSSVLARATSTVRVSSACPFSMSRVKSKTVVLTGLGIGVGVCALAATGGLTYLRRRFFGATRSEACKPVILCGPSGAGKSTLLRMLMKEYEHEFGFSVSHTTRDPRPGEKDGVDYNFTTLDKMKKEVASGKFIESNLVHGNMYGTSLDAVRRVEAQSQICVLDIDIQGVHCCQKADIDATYILILPPSLEELERRLRARGTETEASVQKRMLDARVELDVSSRTRFDGRIRNEDRDTAYLQLRELLRPQIKLCQEVRVKNNLSVSEAK